VVQLNIFSFPSASYREQIAKVSRLKDETIRAIAKNSNEIGLFKEEVSAQLRRLRDFVEEGN
jgi:kinetochore protein NDC80